MLWLLILFVVLVTWVFLRSWLGDAPVVPVVVVTESSEPASLKSLSREEGLVKLEQLIERKPVPETCEEVMYFLREFQKNKALWGVTKEDLRNLYVRKYPWQMLSQWSKTRSCCPDYGKYLQ
jgi:hypothetical protein